MTVDQRRLTAKLVLAIGFAMVVWYVVGLSVR